MKIFAKHFPAILLAKPRPKPDSIISISKFFLSTQFWYWYYDTTYDFESFKRIFCYSVDASAPVFVFQQAVKHTYVFPYKNLLALTLEVFVRVLLIKTLWHKNFAQSSNLYHHIYK